MATYYNTVPAKLVRGDVIEFRPGSYRFTLPAGKYTITAAGAKGGNIEGKPYIGGGGYTDSKTISFNTATVCSASVGSVGVSGGVTYSQTGSGSVLWQYVDYVTQWYDPTTGKYKIPLGSGGTTETVYPGGAGGNTSFDGGNQSVMGNGGGGAQANRNGVGGKNGGPGYITIQALNSAPSTPQNVKLEQPMAGRPVAMSCDASKDNENDAITYVWEGRTDGNPFATIGNTTVPSHTVTAPTSGTTYQVRVHAVDSNGAESAAGVSPARNILYNFPPIISGEDQDYGEINQAFDYSFDVDDPDDSDLIDVLMLLDHTEMGHIQNAVRNKSYSVDLADRWLYLENGEHRLIIRATDSEGAVAERIITFTRKTPGLHMKLTEPIQTRNKAPIRTVQAVFYFDAPSDAPVTVLVSNNARAQTPIWYEYPLAERGMIFEFPEEAQEGEEGFSAQVKIVKPVHTQERIVFSGATFMLNANGNESEKWADNVLFANAFTGALTGIANVGQMARSLDQGLIGSGGGGNALEANADGSYIRFGDLQICFHKITGQSTIWGNAMTTAYYIDNPSNTKATVFSAKGNTVTNWTYPAAFAEMPMVWAQPFVLIDEVGYDDVFGFSLMAIGPWR